MRGEKSNQVRIKKNSQIGERRLQRKQGHGIKGEKKFRKEEMVNIVKCLSEVMQQ